MAIGTLILAGTSLGRPEDIPPRSLSALREADLLVFEEDRPARGFLKAAGIHRDYLKLSEHNEKETIEEAERALAQGKTVVYMSDQGMPGVADPGRLLVDKAFLAGARVTVIPGPSAITAALSACPFDTGRFTFLGLLPREGNDRLVALREADRRREPLVVIDTPYRAAAVIADCAKALGNARRALLALDISGEKERFLAGRLSELAGLAELSEKLNFTLVIEASRAAGSPASRPPKGSRRSPSGFRRGR